MSETQVTWPSVVGAAAITVQALVVLVALVYARRQVIEARSLREAQTRPFVVIDFDVLRLRPMIYLVITNHGPTIARNVRFVFDPPLSSSFDDDHDTVSGVRLLTDGMPTLAPGTEIPILFDSFINRGNERPDAYRITVTYDGEGQRSYEDVLLIDLGVYRNLHYIDRKDMHHVATELKAIAETLKRWTVGLHGGVHVRTDERRAGEEASTDLGDI